MLLAEELLDLAGPEEPSKYAQIAARKSEKVWKKAENNWALGYTGSSQHTQQRNDKASQDQAVVHRKAQTLCVIFLVFSVFTLTDIKNHHFSVTIHRFPICLP